MPLTKEEEEEIFIKSLKLNAHRSFQKHAETACHEFDEEFVEYIMHAYNALYKEGAAKGQVEESVPGDFYTSIRQACRVYVPSAASLDRIFENYDGTLPDSEIRYGESLPPREYQDEAPKQKELPEGWDPAWGDPPPELMI